MATGCPANQNTSRHQHRPALAAYVDRAYRHPATHLQPSTFGYDYELTKQWLIR